MDEPPVITIYNLPPSPARWDRIGIFYITFCVVWTLLVFSGMIFCWINRNNPLLRLRGIALSFSAIVLLHAYWILGQIVYPIGLTMPIVLAYNIQYFFMGVWLPLGIALFHASNSRLLRVAKMQKKYSSAHLRDQFNSSGPYNSWPCRFRCMEYTKKLLVLTGAGMYVQVLLTIGMWFACRKYHPTYGIPGTEIKSQTLPEQIVELGQGWEWWPTVLWQVVWTWMVAPFLIWKTWGIHDTMGWRTQTIGCCLSSLHATPMFLIASYVPAFEPVNAYFPPSSWIHLSIFFMEILTIFVPTFQLIRQRISVRRVENLNVEWEASFSASSSIQELDYLRRGFAVGTHLPVQGGHELSDQERKEILLTSSAFNYTLNSNPRPLQDFSALNDFSGENIAFLTEVTRWKISLRAEPNERDVRDAYNGALDIYANFISSRDADFPLNLASADQKFMERMFETAARETYGQSSVHPATPFDRTTSLESAPASGMEKPYYSGAVPAEFGPGVFDSIEQHIKYLVLTNTWPRFVKQMQSRRRSEETTRSDYSASSEATMVSRLSHKVSKLFYHSD